MIKYRVESAATVDLTSYGSVPISFEVDRRLDLDALAAHPKELVAHPVEPWIKDYDAYERPHEWPERFDLRNWWDISAWDCGIRVGGLVLAHDTVGVDMLEGRSDLAVVWDLRVGPAHRGRGIGKALFLAAIKLSRSLDCAELKVETQDINVGACHLYSSLGCVPSQVVPDAYAGLPGEAMILWRLALKVPALRE